MPHHDDLGLQSARVLPAGGFALRTWAWDHADQLLALALELHEIRERALRVGYVASGDGERSFAALLEFVRDVAAPQAVKT